MEINIFFAVGTNTRPNEMGNIRVKAKTNNS